MRVALLILLCTFSEAATAQTTQCQSVPKASDRLACYDRAAPPPALSKAATPKQPSTQQGAYVDQLAAENSNWTRSLKQFSGDAEQGRPQLSSY